MRLSLLFLFFSVFFELVVFGSETRVEFPTSCGTSSAQRIVLSLFGESVPFRWIPQGEFIMGSPDDEPMRDSEAEVPHQVIFTSGFWMMETEVSQKLYFAVTGERPSSFHGDLLPVDTVSWFDAVQFCHDLNQRLPEDAPMVFQLPSEAQWEYAARAGDSGSGLKELNERGWSGEPNETGCTHEVGTKKANSWGLFDMQGNLWEWCADTWQDYSTESVIDPYYSGDPNSVTVRIDRGGCWDSTPEYCRFAWRGVYEPERKSRYVGFRVIFAPEKEISQE